MTTDNISVDHEKPVVMQFLSFAETEVTKQLNNSDNKFKVLEVVSASGELSSVEEVMKYVSKTEPETGFLIISANITKNKLVFGCQTLTPIVTSWINHIFHNIVGEYTYVSEGDSTTGPLFGTFTGVEYVEKLRDAFMSHGVGYLRINKLITSVVEEDDYIDPIEYGLGAW